MLNVLRELYPHEEHEHGFYGVEFPTGPSVKFSAKGLANGCDFSDCAFHVRGLINPMLNGVFLWIVIGLEAPVGWVVQNWKVVVFHLDYFSSRIFL